MRLISAGLYDLYDFWFDLGQCLIASPLGETASVHYRQRQRIPYMRWVVLRWVVLAVVVVLSFVIVERNAAPPFGGRTELGDMPTRSLGGVRYGGWPRVNDACHRICESHCANRWGESSLAYPLRGFCYLNCVDVACTVQ
jgi:hypothetical protein